MGAITRAPPRVGGRGGGGRFQGGSREDSGRAECVRRIVTNHSLISPCTLSVISLLSPCSLSVTSLLSLYDHIIAVIPHTHVVILNAAKNLVIGMIVSLFLPDPSTPLRFAQDDKGEEFSGRVQRGFREIQGGRSALGALSLTSFCFLLVLSLFPLCFLSDHIIAVIPRTHVVILSIAKNLVIGMIVSLLLPDPSTSLCSAQDDKGEEFSGRFQGGLRELQRGFREDSERFQRVFREYSERAECVRRIVNNRSLISPCTLSVTSLLSPCSSPCSSPCTLSVLSMFSL